MQIQVTVTSSDGTANGWFVNCFHWASTDAQAPDQFQIHGWTPGPGGTFTAQLNLAPGNYGLHCDVALSGRSIEVDLAPAPAMVWPIGGSWPFKVKVPTTASQYSDTCAFQVQ